MTFPDFLQGQKVCCFVRFTFWHKEVVLESDRNVFIGRGDVGTSFLDMLLLGSLPVATPAVFFKYKIMLLFSIHLMQLVKSCTKQFRF